MKNICIVWVNTGRECILKSQFQSKAHIMTDLIHLTACAAVDMLKAGDVTPQEMVDAAYDRIEAVDAGLYRREVIELEADDQQQPVEAYFYLPPTEGLEDCGSCWDGIHGCSNGRR